MALFEKRSFPLRDELKAAVRAERRERWARVQPEIEAAIKAEAARGRTFYNIPSNTDLWKGGEIGYRWAIAQGLNVRTGDHGNGHGYGGSWPQIRWD